MRILYGEFAHDYPSYSFGYTVHAECEDHDAPHTLYEQGFLPASADPSIRNRFYLARSIRVPLRNYTPTSENRRVLKKFDGAFTVEVLDRDSLLADPAFRPCFLTYFADRHGQSVMTEARLDGILRTPLPLRAVRYSSNSLPVAYVLEIAEDGFLHYWFSCFDMSYARASLGMWLMLDAVRRAQEEGRTHLYLGTAYGEKGRYKMNITPLEFWDGAAWNADEKELKRRIAGDDR